MRYIACIVLDGFYVSLAAKDAAGPVVVHRNGRVLDANLTAKAAGIVVGASLSEATAIMRGSGHRIEWEEETYVTAQRRWLQVVSSFSDTVEPVDQHESFIDLTGHPRPREAAERLRVALQARFGLVARVGIASCRWVAKTAAGSLDHLGLAHSDPRNFVARMPVADLPIDPAHARTLSLLGYRRAEDVAALDSSIIYPQFGKDTSSILAAAKGQGDATVRPLFPPNAAATRFAFEGGPTSDRQTFDAALDAIAVELGERLQANDLAGKRVETFLEHDDASVTRSGRTFARPIVCALDLRSALRLMFAEDPQIAPEALRVRLPDLEKARRTQLEISGGRSRSDRDESVRIAIGNVRKAYGEASVLLAADKKELRHILVRRAFEKANGFLWDS